MDFSLDLSMALGCNVRGEIGVFCGMTIFPCVTPFDQLAA